MKNRVFKATAYLALTIVLTLSFAGTSGFAQDGKLGKSEGPSCSAHTLRGLYIFSAHGWNIVGGVAVPKAIVEGIDFDGDGTLSVPFATVSINGAIIRSSGGVGFYTVEADCTGTLTFTGGPSFDIFVQPGKGAKIWMIQTGPAVAPPAVFEGTATKVSP